MQVISCQLRVALEAPAASLPCILDLFTETGVVHVLGTVFGCVWFPHNGLYAFMTT